MRRQVPESWRRILPLPLATGALRRPARPRLHDLPAHLRDVGARRRRAWRSGRRRPASPSGSPSAPAGVVPVALLPDVGAARRAAAAPARPARRRRRRAARRRRRASPSRRRPRAPPDLYVDRRTRSERRAAGSSPTSRRAATACSTATASTVALPGTHPAVAERARRLDRRRAGSSSPTPRRSRRQLTVAATGADALAALRHPCRLARRALGCCGRSLATATPPDRRGAVAGAASRSAGRRSAGALAGLRPAARARSRILSVDLGTERASHAALHHRARCCSPPRVPDGRLLYVRSTARRQQLILGRRPVFATTPTARRDSGHEHGLVDHRQGYRGGRRPPKSERPAAGLTVTLWTTALDGAHGLRHPPAPPAQQARPVPHPARRCSLRALGVWVHARLSSSPSCCLLFSPPRRAPHRVCRRRRSPRAQHFFGAENVDADGALPARPRPAVVVQRRQHGDGDRRPRGAARHLHPQGRGRAQLRPDDDGRAGRADAAGDLHRARALRPREHRRARSPRRPARRSSGRPSTATRRAARPRRSRASRRWSTASRRCRGARSPARWSEFAPLGRDGRRHRAQARPQRGRAARRRAARDEPHQRLPARRQPDPAAPAGRRARSPAWPTSGDENGTMLYQFRVGDFSLIWHDSVGPLRERAPQVLEQLEALPPTDVEVGSTLGFNDPTNGQRDAVDYLTRLQAEALLPDPPRLHRRVRHLEGPRGRLPARARASAIRCRPTCAGSTTRSTTCGRA